MKRRWAQLRRAWTRRPAAATSRSLRGGAIFWGLLAAGLLVRLLGARHAYFADDESLFWATGVDLARGEAFPLVGPPISGTSAGLPGPLFYWVTALPLVLWKHPLFASAFYAALSVLGVALFARVLRAWWGRAAQLSFLVIAISSPWMVLYADRIWAGNLFFFLCATALWGALTLVKRPRARAPSFVLPLMLVAGPQLHLSTVHLALMTFVLLVAGRARPAWKWAFAGALLGAALYAPYLVHELRTDFSNTRLISQHASGGPPTWFGVKNLLQFFFGLATTDVAYFVQRGYWTSFDPWVFWKDGGAAKLAPFFAATGMPWLCVPVLALTCCCTAAGVLALFVRLALRRRRDLLAVAFAVALADVVLLHLLSGKYGFPHYVTIVAPLGFLPLVAALAVAAQWRVGRWAGAAVLVLFTVTSLAELRAYYPTVEGTAADQMEIIETIFAAVPEGQPYTVGFSMQWAFPTAYARLAPRLYGRPWTPGGGGRVWHVIPAAEADQAGTAVVLRMTHLALVAPR